MPDVFTWLPDDKPTGDFPSNVKEVRFGDGYRQIAKEGIDRKEQQWSLSFDRDETVVAAIQQFIDDHEGEWFLWTPPGSNSVQGKYITTGYRKAPYSGDSEKLTVTFEEFKVP